MKKEYLLFASILLLLFGQVIDSISGPVSIPVKNAFQFMSQASLQTYPLTSISILAKTLGLLLLAALFLSLIEKKDLLKGSLLLTVAVLMELYSIQQLATGVKTIPLPWTLALGWAAILLFIPAIFFLVKGLLWGLYNKFFPVPKDPIFGD